jgi:hypothetical protein
VLANIIEFLDAAFNKIRRSQRKALACLVLGLLAGTGASLAAIARGTGSTTSFGVRLKRVWRFVTNPRVDPAQFQAMLLQWLINRLRPDQPLLLLVDWTPLGCDQALIASIPIEGRAVPLFWQFVRTDPDGRFNQSLEEWSFFERLAALIPKRVRVVIVADRGFGNAKLMDLLGRELHFGYVLRVKDDSWVSTGEWQGMLRDLRLVRDRIQEWQRVSYRKEKSIQTRLVSRWTTVRGVPAHWHLVTNLPDPADQIVAWYEKRMWAEEMHRDQKTGFFRLHKTTLQDEDRRSRLFLAIALATLLLTFAGLKELAQGVPIPANPAGAAQGGYRGLSILQLGKQRLDRLGRDALSLPRRISLSLLPLPVPA